MAFIVPRRMFRESWLDERPARKRRPNYLLTKVLAAGRCRAAASGAPLLRLPQIERAAHFLSVVEDQPIGKVRLRRRELPSRSHFAMVCVWMSKLSAISTREMRFFRSMRHSK